MSAVAVVLACIGVFFSLSGTVGIFRMPDLYSRIQCASKTVTMGTIPVLIAVAIEGGVISPFGSRALVVGFLLLVANPASSHALARAAYRRGVPMWQGSVVDQAEELDRARDARSGRRA